MANGRNRSEASLHGVSVLIADDDDFNRELAKVVLDQLGARVEIAADGAQAIELYARRYFDVILMDIHMPGMDGVEAARRIRQMQGQHPLTPIFALTADALGSERDRYLTAHMDGYLSKPLDGKRLAAMVEQWRVAQILGIPEGEPPPPQPPVLDEDMGVAAVGAKAEVWRTVLNMLLEQLPEIMREISAAWAAQDMELLRSLAHRLAGSSGYCGTPALQAAAAALDLACRAGVRGEIETRVDALQAEADKLLEHCVPPDPR